MPLRVPNTDGKDSLRTVHTGDNLSPFLATSCADVAENGDKFSPKLSSPFQVVDAFGDRWSPFSAIIAPVWTSL